MGMLMTWQGFYEEDDCRVVGWWVVNVYAYLYCVCSSAASGPRMEIIVYTRS
jgi:hypothetical protein